jgi:hypothetical protein
MRSILDPISYIESNFTHKGLPFTIIRDNDLENTRHYLRGLYYTIAFKLPNPKYRKPMLILKGRQVEMTTTATNLVAYFLESYPHFPILYGLPQLKLAKNVANDKWGPLYRYRLNKDVLRPLDEGTWTMNVKKFSNGSTLYMEGVTETGDNIRGISAEMLVKDEYQDWDSHAEEVMDECLTHAKYKIDLAFGTPKYTNTHFSKRWDTSTQHRFHLQCATCKHWFPLTLDTMVKGHVIKCPKCQGQEDKRNLIPTGKWIPTGDEKAPFYGFHLSQLYVPYITVEDIHEKIERKTAELGNVERYIKNEILGEFYDGEIQKPSKEHILKAYKDNFPYDIIVPVHTETYAGVDWGGWSAIDGDPENSFTVYTDGFFTSSGILQVNYMEIIGEKDEMDKADHIIELMRKRRVKLLVADSGYGKIQNNHIEAAMPNRFMRCKYTTGNSNQLIDSVPEKRLLKVNRDFSLEELYGAMQRELIRIPKNQHTYFSIEHFLNHDIVLIEQGNHVYKKFIKVSGYSRRVDAVHSINFFRLAALHDKNAWGSSDLALLSLPNRRPPLPVIAGSGYSAQEYMNFKQSVPRAQHRGD